MNSKKVKRRPQVGVTFDEETFSRIESCMSRYKKRDMALVVFEIVKTYIGKYEEAEDSKLETLAEQGVLGKAPAPATVEGRRARKSA